MTEVLKETPRSAPDTSTEEAPFVLFDLDRTLLNTDAFVQVALTTLQVFDNELATRTKEQDAKHKQAGTSFALFRYVQEQLGPEEYEGFLRRLAEYFPDDNCLYPGAADLAKTGGILTYGDYHGQLLKLRLTGLENLPYLITDTSKKGKLISRWRQPDDTFRLPPQFGDENASTVVLVDDKLASFEGLPPAPLSYGVWVLPEAEGSFELYRAAQNKLEAEGLGKRVTVATSLAQTAFILNSLF